MPDSMKFDFSLASDDHPEVDVTEKIAQLKQKLYIKRMRDRWDIRISDFARNTHNPIRAIVDGLKIEPNPEKPMIALSIGDPTIFGNLKPCEETIDSLKKIIEDGEFHGYAPAVGFFEARQAVAKYVSHQGKVAPSDVVLCSGCSCALDLSISVLASSGQNILIPKPGFSIYRTLAEGFDIECRYYDLLPDKNWEVDLKQLESLIDENTSALIITNPSNPCGSVFTKNHLRQIVALAEKYFVPIIADEIYEHFVFPGKEFHSVSSVARNVPVLSCGGLTKRFLVPGWRLGWIIIHDKNNVFNEVRKGIEKLSTRILGANTLVQGALPTILANTPQVFYDELVETLHRHALIAHKSIKSIPGLTPIMPDGAMYMMIAIDVENFPDFENDLDFVQALVKKQSVFCLPGQCFEYPNYIRIVLTVPEEFIVEACARLSEFCRQYYVGGNTILNDGEFSDEING